LSKRKRYEKEGETCDKMKLGVEKLTSGTKKSETPKNSIAMTCCMIVSSAGEK